MMDTLLVQICVTVFGLATAGLHLARKNRNEVLLYAAQSTAVLAMLGVSIWEHHSTALLTVAAVAFIVKVLLAPTFFIRLIKRHQLHFSAETYANFPESLLGLGLIVLLVSSPLFAPLTNMVPGNHAYLVLAFGGLLASMLLIVNRKGALSQAVGVLSLENSIVAFAVFAGMEESAMFELGIMFDLLIWMVIAVVFVALVYRHFGSLDVSKMKRLKD